MPIERPPPSRTFTRQIVDGGSSASITTLRRWRPTARSALTKLVPVSQIVYGTDFPYRTNEDHVRGLRAFFNLVDMKAIDRDNALRLVPRLKTA